MTFEKALSRLETIVDRLEAGQQPLDELLKLYEEGAALARFCREELNRVVGRLQQLVKTHSAEFELKPMQEGENEA